MTSKSVAVDVDAAISTEHGYFELNYCSGFFISWTYGAFLIVLVCTKTTLAAHRDGVFLLCRIECIDTAIGVLTYRSGRLLKSIASLCRNTSAGRNRWLYTIPNLALSVPERALFHKSAEAKSLSELLVCLINCGTSRLATRQISSSMDHLAAVLLGEYGCLLMQAITFLRLRLSKPFFRQSYMHVLIYSTAATIRAGLFLERITELRSQVSAQ